MNPDDERLLLDLACGDRRIDEPEVCTRLAADPGLRQRAAMLLEARDAMDLLGTGAAASPPPGTVPESDRAVVAQHLRPRRRWSGRVSLVVLAATFGLLLWLQRSERPEAVDGLLGGAAAVSVERDGAAWQLRIDEALPPGTSYAVRLELADGTVLSATGDAPTWRFPSDWQQLVTRPGLHRLVVEVTDAMGFARRHKVLLPPGASR